MQAKTNRRTQESLTFGHVDSDELLLQLGVEAARRFASQLAQHLTATRRLHVLIQLHELEQLVGGQKRADRLSIPQCFRELVQLHYPLFGSLRLQSRLLLKHQLFLLLGRELLLLLLLLRLALRCSR